MAEGFPWILHVLAFLAGAVVSFVWLLIGIVIGYSFGRPDRRREHGTGDTGDTEESERDPE